MTTFVSQSGLTSAQATERLALEGPNELPSEHRPSLWSTLVALLREPMLILLLSAAGLYFLLGDRLEAVVLLGFVLVVITIELVQERRTERALSALKALSSPRALVVRDGRERRVAGREVVRGDVVLLSEGDRVPADGRLLVVSNLACDESLLTGESVPVTKLLPPSAQQTPTDDAATRLFSGTLVVRGHAAMEVEATGPRTELGRIGASLASVRVERTPLAREIERLVRIIAWLGGATCLALFALLALSRGRPLDALLSGISLAMAILPEEFPVILTVFMALGAVRLSRYRVLARRPQSIETLGSITVLCTDKTGTLTENRMRIAELDTGTLRHAVGREPLPEAFHALVEVGILASQREPFDPMELAFKALGERDLAGTEHLHESWVRVREYPLSSELLSMAHVHRDPEGTPLVVAAKGAPEAIVDLCHLPASEAARILARVEELAASGLRVLGLARALHPGAALPDGQHAFDFELVGLVGLEDPLRAKVPEAVKTCAEAGIRVLMITGDYPATASAIARRSGIASDAGVLLGSELAHASEEELDRALREKSVIARAVPELKLRIVRSLLRQGEVVAMTGDGVNDAPALRAAHVGIAMGERGTDVAREAASLVITDDDFGSIVAGIRLGRRIFANLQRALAYTVAVHVPIVGLSLLPALFGLAPALFPVHIVFLELMIDPTCALAFEAEEEEPGLMQRPPRKAGAPLLTTRVLWVSLLQGVAVLAPALGCFALALARGLGADEARTLGFTALIGGNISLVLVNRSWSESALKRLGRKNRVVWLVLGLALLALVSSLSVPGLRAVFHFAVVSPRWLLSAVFGGFLALFWFEVLKVVAPGWLTRLAAPERRA